MMTVKREPQASRQPARNSATPRQRVPDRGKFSQILSNLAAAKAGAGSCDLNFPQIRGIIFIEKQKEEL